MPEREPVTAYFILDVLVDAPPALEIPEGYAPSAKEGTIVLRYDNPGTGTHEFVFPDGPINVRATAVYVGKGTVAAGEGEQGHTAQFDYSTQRLMMLLVAGWHAEKAMQSQIHDFADQVNEIIDEAQPKALQISRVKMLEKGWFKTHDVPGT